MDDPICPIQRAHLNLNNLFWVHNFGMKDMTILTEITEEVNRNKTQLQVKVFNGANQEYTININSLIQ